MKTKLGASQALLALILSGCGGGAALSTGLSPLAACHQAPACGGDIVGTWSIASTCFQADLSSFTDGCAGSVGQMKDYLISGTISYGADSTFTLESTRTGSAVVRYPAACLTPPDGIQVTCEQLGPALASGGEYDSVECLSNGAGCDCTFGLTPETVKANGPYSITPDKVLTVGTDDQSHYCVKGDGTAALSTLSTSPVLGHQGLTGGVLTLTKQ